MFCIGAPKLSLITSGVEVATLTWALARSWEK